MAWRAGLVMVLSLASAVLTVSQEVREQVTVRRGDLTITAYLKEPVIPVGGVFILIVEVTRPVKLRVGDVRIHIPEGWIDRVIQLSYLVDLRREEKEGKKFVTVIYTYRFAPLKTGKVKLDNLVVSVFKQPFPLPPLVGEVRRGFEIPEAPVEVPPGPSIKVTASLSNRSPFVGEQVVYALRFAALKTLDFAASPTYEPPTAEGCLTEEFPKLTRRKEGNYEVQIVRIALFPLREGRLSVSPAKIIVHVEGEPSPQDFQTPPLSLTARPLPTPAPKGFQNLVGKVFTSLRVHPKRIAAGEVVTVTLLVEGTANLQNLMPPPLDLPDARVGIPRDRFLAPKVHDGKLWMRREFVWRLVPLREGTLTIPSFRFPYFDPIVKRYLTAMTSPVTVSVLPGQVLPQAPVKVRPLVPFPLAPLALLVFLVLLTGAFGFHYWRRQRILAKVPVPDPQLRQTALILYRRGLSAFRREVRDWLRDQIYQRTGVLLSPTEASERVQKMLMKKGVSEAAARFIREIWEHTETLPSREEALQLLRRIAEVPRRL